MGVGAGAGRDVQSNYNQSVGMNVRKSLSPRRFRHVDVAAPCAVSAMFLSEQRPCSCEHARAWPHLVIWVLGVDRACRVALVGWCIASADGCAAISGLDQIEKVPCAPFCHDRGDLTSDASADDLPIEEAAAADPTKVAADASVIADSVDDAPDTMGSEAMDDGADANAISADSRGDESSDGSDCGAPNSVDNCGACGVTCPTPGAVASIQSASCVSGDGAESSTCTYTCAPGFLDCNASTFPNRDGCECAVARSMGASCCSAGCPVLHNDGLGRPTSAFYGCSPPGTIDFMLAMDACVNFAGSLAICTSGACMVTGTDAATGDDVVCARTANDCPCWTYRGRNVGYVRDSGSATQCRCSNGPLGNDTRFF